MIVEFTIQNFRSIKDEQIFSFNVENPKQHLTQNVAYVAGARFGVLRSAGIYGANASGKSNILLAFEALRYMACASGNLKEGGLIPCYEPYLLSESSKISPVKFELEFTNEDDIRYIYAVSFNNDSILNETLDFYPAGKKANIFKRTASDTWKDIAYGDRYKGGTRRIPFFKNNSYLSKAGDNASSPELIRDVYRCLANHLNHLGVQESVIVKDFYNKNEMLDRVAKVLCHVDTGISAIQTKIREGKIVSPFPDDFPQELKTMWEEKEKRSFLFAHKNENGGVEFFRESLESAGTQKLFEMLPLLIRVFAAGAVLICDELDHSFHPHIAELVIKLFNDPITNSNNAQLIFSTHNISLMSSSNMRRDQIWFTEKRNGQTSLFSLDDFDKNKVKSDSPFDTWYNEGRFGALPSIDYLAISSLLKPIENDIPVNTSAISLTDGNISI